MQDLQEERVEGVLVDIRHATVYRDTHCVLKNLSLRIPIGCSTVILGPNGSGKSTLMKLLTRELYPIATAQTSIQLLGQRTWNVWDLRRQLGMVSADLHHDYLGDTPVWMWCFPAFSRVMPCMIIMRSVTISEREVMRSWSD